MLFAGIEPERIDDALGVGAKTVPDGLKLA